MRINTILLPLRRVTSDGVLRGAARTWLGAEVFLMIRPPMDPYRAPTEPAARSLIDHESYEPQQLVALTYSFQLAFSRRETDGGRDGGTVARRGK